MLKFLMRHLKSSLLLVLAVSTANAYFLEAIDYFWDEISIRFGQPGKFYVKIEKLTCRHNNTKLLSAETYLMELDHIWHDYEYCGDCKNGCECTFYGSFFNDIGDRHMEYIVYIEAVGCDGLMLPEPWWHRYLAEYIAPKPPFAKMIPHYGHRAIVMVPSVRNEDVYLIVRNYTFDANMYKETATVTGSPAWWHGDYLLVWNAKRDWRSGVPITNHFDVDYLE